MSEPRRARAYRVPEHAVWGLLAARWATPGVLCLAFFDGVPDDVTVHSVRHDYLSRSYLFVLEHPSFEEWHDGADCPDGGPISWQTVELDLGDGGTRAPAWQALREENRRLRLVFSDLLEDDARLKAAFEQGRAEGWRDGREALTCENMQPDW
jgi:hypothetical protein